MGSGLKLPAREQAGQRVGNPDGDPVFPRFQPVAISSPDVGRPGAHPQGMAIDLYLDNVGEIFELLCQVQDKLFGRRPF